jgi:hypothetical protein
MLNLAAQKPVPAGIVASIHNFDNDNCEKVVVFLKVGISEWEGMVCGEGPQHAAASRRVKLVARRVSEGARQFKFGPDSLAYASGFREGRGCALPLNGGLCVTAFAMHCYNEAHVECSA